MKKLLSLIPTSYAADTDKPVQLSSVNIGDIFGFGHIKSLGQGVSYLVIPALTIATIAVLIYFVSAAVQLIFSGGDKAKVQAARDKITHSIIGVILLLLAFVIIPFVMGYFKLPFAFF